MRLSLDESTQVTKSSRLLQMSAVSPESHAPIHGEGRIGDGVGTDAHMALLDVLRCLRGQLARCPATHHLDSLRHPELAHDDRQAPTAESADGDLGIDVADLGRRVDNVQLVKLAEQRGLVLAAKRIRFRQLRQAVGEGADRAAEPIVRLVVLAAPSAELELTWTCRRWM